MNRGFIVGARPLHDDGMLRLGLRQLAESEVLLRKLVVSYEQTKDMQLAYEIAQECSFISQTLGALIDMTCYHQADFTASGALLKASKYLRLLVEKAEGMVRIPSGAHGNVA